MIYSSIKNNIINFYRNSVVRSEFSKKRDGFTLIEVVLILILVGGVFMTFYSVFTKTIIGDKESINEVIASNLAQEGVEIVRNMRDENILLGDAINQDLSDGSCFPFWSGSGRGECSNAAVYSQEMEVDSFSGKYQNCSMGGCTLEETPYKRTCHIEALVVEPSSPPDGETAFAVSCVVEWNSFSGILRKARAMTILTNWYESP